MYKNRAIITDHLKDHATIYLFMIILFMTGIVFGAILVNSMSVIQKQDLIFYLERFFGQLHNQQLTENTTILKNSFFYHVKYLLLLFILGLSVIGLPIVWILLFIKGLVVGFSVGFIVNQLGMDGFLLATFSIAPQNILIIPIYIVAGSLAMIFSLKLLGKLFTRKVSQPVFQPFGRYAMIFGFLLILSFAAALLETYVSNEAMTYIVKSFYQ
ncbi:stage II sporulation protein M [Oceanobacillus picturae]|jgi:stage II sporulation protein M|uniref:Stage II sporulation protein M n=1 Tax=Oceanobacillus picturae TaxID=171693 RepID=W9AGC2_9BACI|nr:stage II sporulation protein M [Oceanobacillus picturae]RIU96113.1 stage II sporulation protein M [Oceanobacillus picturae]GAQ17514.1 stage II sporulation protein M [Oceanobacillus picturae]CDO01972.1 Stage II sporulation protein M [Oceanobacillus picturae]